MIDGKNFINGQKKEWQIFTKELYSISMNGYCHLIKFYFQITFSSEEELKVFIFLTVLFKIDFSL